MLLSKFVHRQMYSLPGKELNRPSETDSRTSLQAVCVYSKRAWDHKLRISYLPATDSHCAQDSATAAICRHIFISDQWQRHGQHNYNVTW